jgi:hypothetical protein
MLVEMRPSTLIGEPADKSAGQAQDQWQGWEFVVSTPPSERASG